MTPMDAAVDVSPEPYIPAAGEGAAPRRVTILGSTGSIGCNTIDLIARHPEAFEVEALTAQRSVAQLAEQARAVGARQAVIGDAALYGALKEALTGTDTVAAAGRDALVEAAGARSFVMPGSSCAGPPDTGGPRARRRHSSSQQECCLAPAR